MNRKNIAKKKKAGSTPWPGRMLARLPASGKLLYPLYLARQLDLVESVYRHDALPEAFDGLRLAYVSDIHFGPLFGEDRVRALSRRVNELEADIVLLGGDYGVNSDGAVAFFDLKPGFRAKKAVLAAFGNHDRTLPENNVDRIVRSMRADGVIPVLNDAWTLDKSGFRLAFASTDDLFNGFPDYEKVARLCAGADFTVFFPHNPDTLPETYTLPGGLFYQLAVCGHTHGGQVSVRGHAIKSSSLYGDRFLSGWYREEGADILVSNGVGVSGLPVRLGARAQFHLIILRRK